MSLSLREFRPRCDKLSLREFRPRCDKLSLREFRPRCDNVRRSARYLNSQFSIFKKFCIMVVPCGVRMDSGWNCTP